MGIAYYAVFELLQQVQETGQMDGQLLKVFELRGKHYVELPQPFWMEDVGLGLTIWEGEFEGVSSQWLRWCDRDGQVIPTGAEGREIERQRAERLAERLRAMGVNPDEV